jgi:hypothetical protein
MNDNETLNMAQQRSDAGAPQQHIVNVTPEESQGFDSNTDAQL